MTRLNIFILIILSCSSIYAQKDENLQTSIENLSKKWEFFDVINTEKTPEELKEIKSMLEATSLELRRDLTFTFSFVLDLEGTWSLKGNLIFTEDRKGKNKWVVHSLKDDTLVASRNDSSQRIVFKAI